MLRGSTLHGAVYGEPIRSSFTWVQRQYVDTAASASNLAPGRFERFGGLAGHDRQIKFSDDRFDVGMSRSDPWMSKRPLLGDVHESIALSNVEA